MYTVNKTRSHKKLIAMFFFTLLAFFALCAFLVWFFIIRDTDSSSANFSRTGGTVAVVRPTTKEFTVDEFKITLPDGWELNGKESPYSDETYYSFQSMVKDYTNRWLKVYIDNVPLDYPLSRLSPIKPVSNKIEMISDRSPDCKTFEESPEMSAQNQSKTWTAEWGGIDFICNVANVQNHTGTASEKDGYAVPVTGLSGKTHKYFFVYIDHNIRPDYTILDNAIKSFEAL